MLAYKFFVDQTRNNALRLRLTNNRKKVEISVGVRLTQESLADALSPKPHPENVRWKSLLSGYMSKLDEIQCEMLKSGNPDEDVAVIRDVVLRECFNKEPKVEEKPKGDFVTHFQKFIDRKTNRKTKEVYQYTLNRIKAWDPDVESKSFEDIKIGWLNDFEDFCAKTSTKNARNVHLRNIRAVFNSAIDYEITTAYPFRRFKIRPEATRKRSLSVEDLRRVFDYPIEPYAEIYRDMFKLIFLLVGINCVDLYGLKEITDGRIEYRRSKTGRLYSVKVEPEALELIEKYRGDKALLCLADRWGSHRNFRHQTNKALRRMGEVRYVGHCGKKIVTPEFPNLTTYYARHTWATIARSIGVSVDDIALALGHGDGHALTHIYIDEDIRRVDEANRKVIDYVLYGKR